MLTTQSSKTAAFARPSVPYTQLGRRASSSTRQQLQQPTTLKGFPVGTATARRARPQTQVLRRVKFFSLPTRFGVIQVDR